MRTSTKLFAGLFVTALAVGVPFLPTPQPPSSVPKAPAEAHFANATRLQTAYVKWRADQDLRGGESNLLITLGWSRGLSTENTTATGLARIDPVAGLARVEVEGLNAAEGWDVWLVDNQEGPGRSALPERGDHMHRLGSLGREGGRATLTSHFDPRLFDDFQVDVVAVTRAGVRPEQGAVLYGSPMLFQRFYAREKQQGVTGPDTPIALARSTSLLGFGPRPAFADTPFNSLDPLVSQGADIFFNEQFNGNGRVCATCHPAENNFTLDPKFIAALPANSPLFVGETSANLGIRFERPLLLRRVGLVLENVDGFEDLDNKFVMRAVPQLLGLSRYLVPGNQSNPPAQRTGWGGDGAPGSGTLREFATGAVIQHLTRDLQRRPGVDFRLPTDAELDALEAFQLALGRQDNPDLTTFRVKDPLAALGLQQHNQLSSRCFICHLNAGANAAANGKNNNFDVGVGRLPNSPARLIDPAGVKPDGGFGRDPVCESTATPPCNSANPQFLGFGLAGEVRFNSQPAIEAVDTAPFFHDHSVQTIEEAVGFYNSDAFKHSFAGGLLPIHMETTEVENIAAFLRVMNAIENIRSTLELVQAAIDEPDDATARRLADLASFDTEDGYQVLEPRDLHRTAVAKLKLAFKREKTAAATANKPARDAILRSVLRLAGNARGEMQVE